MTSSSLSPLLPDCVAESSFSRLLRHPLTGSITTAATAFVQYVLVCLDSALWIPACCWHCSSSACCWHCSFFTASWVPSLAVSLSFTSVRAVFFCSPQPSPASIGLLFRAPSARWIRLLLPLSWLTDSVSVSLVVGLLFCASALQTSSSFVPILGFGTWVPALVGFCWPDCDFLVVKRPRRVTLAQLRAPLRLFCSSSSILW